MSDDAEAARRDRQRAKEVRAILQGMEDPEMRKSLEAVAADYEGLARARIRIGRIARPKWWRLALRRKKK